MASEVRETSRVSIRRLARALEEPASSVGRWVRPRPPEDTQTRQRRCPVSGAPELRARVRALCNEPRHRTYGYRRIWALLRRQGAGVNRKTVWRIMHDEGLVRPKVWHRPLRPKRVEKMRPTAPNQAWQVDMTSFQLTDLTPLFLVVVTDCCTREIVGWTLDRRCRASEWVSAVRRGLESRGLVTQDACRPLTVRSDNGAQPCSKAFREYLGTAGVRGQYTGYSAPDDNAYVERLIRTLKEEEIWGNAYDTWAEAHQALDAYIHYYNTERIHSALDYRTPAEAAARHRALNAA